MDLMQCTLLADVTIAHPTCKSYRNLVAQKRSPDCVGDASAARKNKKVRGGRTDCTTRRSRHSCCTRTAASTPPH